MRLSLALIFSVLTLLAAFPASAQRELLFGDGKGPTFLEQETDRRFIRSRIGRALTNGSQDPHCVQLLGGLLAVLGEIGPGLHKRDENFSLDPTLLGAVGTQLSSQKFPAQAYVAAMVRRVMIDGKLPDAWLATAEAINPRVLIIDLGKLRFLNEGIKPIDSVYFSIPVLRERYEIEVRRATSAAGRDVVGEFRDVYLDRDVAWGGLVLVDVGVEKRAPKKKKGPKKGPDAEAPPPDEVVALLRWDPPDPRRDQPHLVFLGGPKRPPPVKVRAHLAARQYLDVSKLPRGKQVLVRGRLWEVNPGVTEADIRDALIFEDRPWAAQGVVLATPEAAAMCPLAVNELSGAAPVQPGGFGKH